MRRRRGSGYRQFRAQHAFGIPYIRVRQPLPSGAAQLSAWFRIRRRGNHIIILSNKTVNSRYIILKILNNFTDNTEKKTSKVWFFFFMFKIRIFISIHYTEPFSQNRFTLKFNTLTE